MGANGSKNHRSPTRHHHRHHYDRNNSSNNYPPSAMPHHAAVRQYSADRDHPHQRHLQKRDSSFETTSGFEENQQFSHQSRQMNRQVRQKRPHLKQSSRNSPSPMDEPDRVGRPMLRPILAPHQHHQQQQQPNFEASTLQRSGRYLQNQQHDHRLTMTLPSAKQVQFSNSNASSSSSRHNPPSKLSFSNSGARRLLDPAMGNGEALETSAVFTRSNDSHRASQMAVSVTHRQDVGAMGAPPPYNRAATLDRRVIRAPTRTSTMRRPMQEAPLSVPTLTRYRSDPNISEEPLFPVQSSTLPRHHHLDGTVPRQPASTKELGFNVEDLIMPHHQGSLQRQQSKLAKFQQMRRPGAIPSLLNINHLQQHHQALSQGSVTELSDIVAANSADSGLAEMKPELFSLLSDSPPSQGRRHQRQQPSQQVQHHHSLPRQALPQISASTNTLDNRRLHRQKFRPERAKPEQRDEEEEFRPPPCQCEDCRHPINVSRNVPQRYQSLNRNTRQNFASSSLSLPRPLPPEPNDFCYNNDSRRGDDEEDDECPYEGCCCQPNNGGGEAKLRQVDDSESDYQRLVHRSYKGQPPALRRGQVVPARQQKTQSTLMSDSDDIYTAAFSADSSVMMLKPKSTKARRAPEPPRPRPRSMFTISPENSEKENSSLLKEDFASSPIATTYLAKESTGALVIVNRQDLEAGLLSGKYVQYDIAPALLLDQVAAANQQQQQPLLQHHHSSSLLMTCHQQDANDGSATITANNNSNNNNNNNNSSHYDSGVSPADSSSCGPQTSSNVVTSSSSSASSSAASSPPLLPPRQRGSGAIVSANSSSMPQRGAMHPIAFELAKAGLVDSTLRELSCVAPPLSYEDNAQ